MIEQEITEKLTLYPSPEWNAFCKNRNVFNCNYEQADNQNEFTLKTICHYVQLLGDQRLRTVAERLKRHLIIEKEFEMDTHSITNYFNNDEKLQQIAIRIFKDIYAYTEAIKGRVEKLYDCSLKLEESETTFERFKKIYFSSTEEKR